MNKKIKINIYIVLIVLTFTIFINTLVTNEQNIEDVPIMFEFCDGVIYETGVPWSGGDMYRCDDEPFFCNETDCSYIFKEVGEN